MLYVRRYLRERLQDEASFVHGRMRNRQFLSVNDLFTEQKNIEVDYSRPLCLCSTATHLLLDLQQAADELRRGKGCGQGDRAVYEPGLIFIFHRFCFIECRNCVDCSEFAQLLDRMSDVGDTVANIGAQREICRLIQND